MSAAGSEPESIDKLFEAFYTTKSGGMGVGLSVSHSRSKHPNALPVTVDAGRISANRYQNFRQLLMDRDTTAFRATGFP